MDTNNPDFRSSRWDTLLSQPLDLRKPKDRSAVRNLRQRFQEHRSISPKARVRGTSCDTGASTRNPIEVTEREPLEYPEPPAPTFTMPIRGSLTPQPPRRPLPQRTAMECFTGHESQNPRRWLQRFERDYTIDDNRHPKEPYDWLVEFNIIIDGEAAV